MKKNDKSNYQGLSESDVIAKHTQVGFNELDSDKRQNFFQIFIEVVRDPMLLLLLSIGLIYLFIGELSDALILLMFVFVVLGITFYQKRKTERALDALKNLSSPRALVIRDGKQIRIPGREVVCDDMVILNEGDRVPADLFILENHNLLIDESLLTGESLPVRKSEWDKKIIATQPGGDDKPYAYAGTMVVQGSGIARVSAIGMKTEMGKIGSALNAINEEQTLLQKETKKLVRNFALVGIILCVIILCIYGLFYGDWLEGVLSGLTLGMAILPEEFSVVLVIFLALGAWRISKGHVLTRRLPAIETLGATTTLCTDKTGTLTQNRMTLQALFTHGETFTINPKTKKVPEPFHTLIEYAVLASQSAPADPIEIAIQKVADTYLANTEHLHDTWKLEREYPLSKKLLALSHVWSSPDHDEFIVASKGAPEAILDLCHIPQNEMNQYKKTINYLADQGLRLIGVAQAHRQETPFPYEQHDFEFKFLGILGFADPIRSQVPFSIEEAYRAGIKIIMITGDYAGTAKNIGRQIGLHDITHVLNGEDIAKRSVDSLKETLATTSICSRVVPEQKLNIVQALKKNNEIVAMTGDGVNDAPALKAAHVGIAMGKRGTDVAREAASLVLLDDDFSSIIKAIKLGRRIFDNLKKSMSYILAIHIPIAGVAFMPVLFNSPIVLLPIHIAFLELIIDPACSVVFENDPSEPDIMRRPPRKLNEPILGKRELGMSILQGVSVLFIVMLIYIGALLLKKNEIEIRTLTFSTLVIANLGLILVNLSWSKNIFRVLTTRNTMLWAVLAGAISVLVICVYAPFAQNIFHLMPLHFIDIIIVLIAGAISVMWFEFLKHKKISL